MIFLCVETKEVNSISYQPVQPEFSIPVLRPKQKHSCFVPLQILRRTGHFGKNTKKKKKKKPRPCSHFTFLVATPLQQSFSISSLSLVFLLLHLSSKLAPLLFFFLLTNVFFNFLCFLFLSNKSILIKNAKCYFLASKTQKTPPSKLVYAIKFAILLQCTLIFESAL